MDFINDEEKMRDFYELSKEEFLNSYSYLTENDYEATIKALNDTSKLNKDTTITAETPVISIPVEFDSKSCKYLKAGPKTSGRQSISLEQASIPNTLLAVL